MKLLFLHGSPATGKLTTARALLRMVPGRLMDNHAVIDFVRTIFDFDAPGFWPLIHDVRNRRDDYPARTPGGIGEASLSPPSLQRIVWP